MHLQAAVLPYERFVRCIGSGRRRARSTTTVRAAARPLPHGPRLPRPALKSELEDITLTINAFFGWDFNSCEALLRAASGIRSTSPTPVRTRRSPRCTTTSVAHQGEPALGDLLCRDPPPRAPQPRVGALLRDRRQDLPYREKLRRYAISRARRSTPRPSRNSASATSAPGRGRRRVLRHRAGTRRRAAEGHGAVPDARGRRVHGAVLRTHPAVARRRGPPR